MSETEGAGIIDGGEGVTDAHGGGRGRQQKKGWPKLMLMLEGGSSRTRGEGGPDAHYGGGGSRDRKRAGGAVISILYRRTDTSAWCPSHLTVCMIQPSGGYKSEIRYVCVEPTSSHGLSPYKLSWCVASVGRFLHGAAHNCTARSVLAVVLPLCKQTITVTEACVRL